MQKYQNKFISQIESSPKPILADGAMGTYLHARGIRIDESFDHLNLINPTMVRDAHRSYIDAGAEIIYTNTFSANSYKLSDHGLENKVSIINRVGVELAREAAAISSERVFVAGDIGPLGVRLAPYGRVKREDAKQAFIEQIEALCDAGIDLLVFETFGDLYEIREAVKAAKEVCKVPVIASISFTRDDRTILGDTPVEVVEHLLSFGVDIIGANCSGGPAQLFRIISQMKTAEPRALYLVKPNAGWPEQVRDRVLYTAGPDYFGEYVYKYSKLGINIIGGCCGTTPIHIARMKEILEKITFSEPGGRTEGGETIITERSPVFSEKTTQLAQKLSAGEFVISTEMDPPRGLSTQKIIAGAYTLAEAGADVINIADSPMARMRMSPWAVCALIQRDVGIETTLHFPTRGRNLLRVQGDLLATHALGIRNVFVVMGDPTSIGDYPEAMDDYDFVPSGLMKLINQKFNQGFDHAGAEIDQPTHFFVGCALNLQPTDPDREIKILRRKISNGADFALTQPVYQPDMALDFITRYEERFGVLGIPVLVGVLPIFGPRHASFLQNEVPGITIPDEIYNRISKAGEDAPHEGVRIAVEIINQIKKWGQGIYLIPAFGRYDLAAEIIETVKSTESFLN